MAGRRVGKFSLGMGQRLGHRRRVARRPVNVVILDEPVNGLDPEGIRWVRSLARRLADDGRTVFISSHLMSEMSMMADHLIVIGRGRILADCTVTEFMAEHAASYVRVRTPAIGDVAGLLERSGLEVQKVDDELRVQGLDASSIGELVGRNGHYLHELTLVRSSLEDAFMTLTADAVEYHAGGTTQGAASMSTATLERPSTCHQRPAARLREHFSAPSASSSDQRQVDVVELAAMVRSSARA